MKLDFAGRTALVTGGGGGIGKAICLAFADAGARVACVDRDAVQGAAVIETSRGLGRDALFISADVADAAQVQAYVRETLAVCGRIDVFANNAGIEGVVHAITDY